MRLTHLSPGERECLAVFEALAEPVSIKVLGPLVPCPAEDLPALISKLVRERWLRRVDDERFYLDPDLPDVVIRELSEINSQERLRDLLETIKYLGIDCRLSPERVLDLLDRAGQVREAAGLSYQCALENIENEDFPAAFAYQLKTVSLLTDFSGDAAVGRLYVSASLSLSDLSVRDRRRLEEVLTILQQALQAARRLGDERSIALIMLHIGRIHHILNRQHEAMEALGAGLAAVKSLADEDIMVQAAEFFGLYYLIQGMFSEAAEYFEQALSSTECREGRVFNVTLVVYSAGCAVYLGQYYRAIGLMESNWRRALLSSDQAAARFFEAFLGMVLLMMGSKQEAYSRLKAAEREAEVHDDIWSLIWSQRALAYYYHLEGRTNDACTLLKACLSKAAAHGIHRPVYLFPWLLELLFTFQQREYDPVPGYEFEQEMETALNGPNAHLRGTALRLRAKQAQAQGEDSGRVLELLEKSQADLVRVRDPFQLSKTRAELALVKLGQGSHDEALNLALAAWEGLSVYGDDFFPHKLKSLIKAKGALKEHPRQDDDLLNHYIEMMDKLVPTADADEMFSRLVAASSQLFEAERGALFWFDDHDKPSRPAVRAMYHLTREEIEGERFRSILNLVLKAHKINQPILARIPPPDGGSTGGRQKTALCLPFDIEERVLGVIYHDVSYSDGAFERFNRTTLKRLTQHVGTYISRIIDYSRKLEEKSLMALRQTTLAGQLGGDDLIAQSLVMRDMLNRADKAAGSEAPVLILGETGVGKELLARRLHAGSARGMRPLIAVNLAAVPETLVESELFGHEKGAFTGASYQKPGRMELAHKGTLFIDEVGEIPPSVQIKLLRALEEKTFFRLGGTRNVAADFRLIAASNRDLQKEVEKGLFRKDLYYRLNVMTMLVPPLRERGSDVILLTQHYLSYYTQKYNRPLPPLTSEDKARLKAYHWPGNIRELKNMVERAVILSDGFDLDLTIPHGPRAPSSALSSLDHPFFDQPTMDELQRRYIHYILKETRGKLSGRGGASVILGMKRSTLYDRMKKLGFVP